MAKSSDTRTAPTGSCMWVWASTPPGHHQETGTSSTGSPTRPVAHLGHPAVGPDEHVGHPLAVDVEDRSAPEQHGATQPHGRRFTNQ